MASTALRKAKQGTSKLPQVLTQSERALLRQDMKVSSEWMRAELKRRRQQRDLIGLHRGKISTTGSER